MNKNDMIQIYSNPQPIPSTFNEGFSQYEDILYLIGLTNSLINNQNVGADEIVDLGNKKVSITDLETNRKLSANGDFTGTWFNLLPTAVPEGLSAYVDNLSSKGEINVLVPPLPLAPLNGDGMDEGIKIQGILNLGRPVYFPSTANGYKTSLSLVATNNVRGDQTLIKGSGLNKILTYDNPSNITVQGMIFDGTTQPYQNGQASTTYDLLYMSGNATNVKVKNCGFQNSNARACRIGDGVDISFCNNKISMCNSGFELKLDDITKAFISKNIYVNENIVEGVNGIGLLLQPYLDQTEGAEQKGGSFQNVYMQNNIVKDCYLVGIEIYGCCDGGVVSGNIVDKCGVSTTFGSALAHGSITIKHSRNIKVNNNTCLNSYNGVEILGNSLIQSDGYVAQNIKLIGNTVTNAYNSGLCVFRECDGITFYENELRRNKTAISCISETQVNKNIKIHDNMILENNTSILVSGRNTKNVDIYNNTIIDTNFMQESSTNRAGILIDNSLQADNTTMSNIRIYNNTIDDTRTVGYKTQYGIFLKFASDVDIRNNKVVNCTDNRVRRDSCLNIRQDRNSNQFTTSAPASGTWGVGDRIINSVPTVGQPKSWVCTVEGTPGTWVSEGNL